MFADDIVVYGPIKQKSTNDVDINVVLDILHPWRKKFISEMRRVISLWLVHKETTISSTDTVEYYATLIHVTLVLNNYYSLF